MKSSNKQLSVDELSDMVLAAQVAHFQQVCLQLDHRSLHQAMLPLLEHALEQPINRFLPSASVQAHLQTLLYDTEWGKELHKWVSEWLLAQQSYIQSSDWTWNQVTNVECLMMLANRLDEQKTLRHALIKAVLNSQVYRQLISDVLYAGIRSFFQQERLLSKLPAMGSLMKLGRLGLGKVAPGLEEMVSPIAKSFIGLYVDTALQVSEHSLMQSFDNGRFQQMAEHIWQHIESKPLADMATLLDLSHVEHHMSDAEPHWQQLRTAPATQDLINHGIKTWVEGMMDMQTHWWLSLLGLTPSLLAEHTVSVFSGLCAQLESEGQLQQILYKILEPSYASSEMQAALEKALAS